MVWMGDHNNVDNPHLDVSPPEAWRAHAGAEALQDASADFNLLDAWRCMNGAALEFTRFPGGQRAHTDAKRRLDRTLVSAPALDQTVPRVRAAWHIHPTDPLLYPISTCGQPSDRAGVALTLAFSAQPKPAPTWSFPPRHLRDEVMRRSIEAIIVRCQRDHAGAACLASIRERVQSYVQTHDIGVGRQRARSKSYLSSRIADIQTALGIHLGPARAPPLRGEVRASLSLQLAVYRRRLRALLDEEAQEWLEDRGYEGHVEDRPTKDFYRSLEMSDAERRIPVEAVTFRGKRARSPTALCDTARQTFQKRFCLPPEHPSDRVEAARARCLAALRARGYVLPDQEKENLEFD